MNNELKRKHKRRMAKLSARRTAQRYIAGGVLLSSVITLSACSSSFERLAAGDRGMVTIHADAAGLRELSNMQTGLVNEAKTPAEMMSSHYQLEQQKELTKRQRFVNSFGGKRNEK